MLRDVASSKLRSALVVLSIAVGVFAAGSIAGARVAIERMLAEGYVSVAGPHATLGLSAVPEAALEIVRGTPGVAVAELRRTATIRARRSGGPWRELSLRVLQDPDRIPIDRLRPESGQWPAPERTLLLERSAMELFGIGVGDRIEVEAAGGGLRAVEVSGTVQDLSLRPSGLSGEAGGYVSPETLTWLGESRVSEVLNLRLAESVPDRERVERVARAAVARLADANLRVDEVQIPDPGRFWAHDIVDAMTGILTLLGAVTVAMSAFLAVNTVTALLAEQTRQIGVMKAIGADARQIAGLYLVAVLVYGTGALALGVPLAALASTWLAGYSTRLLNLAPPPLTVTPEVLALEFGAGLVVPLLAALGPVLAGSRLTVREALASHGIGGGQPAGGALQAVTRALRLGRPAALSFRNTFRKRWRLALTVGTLTLSGAAFVATLSVREALLAELDAIFGIANYDVEIRFAEPYPVAPVLRHVRSVPEAVGAEAWAARSATLVRDGESTGETFAIVGVPPDTALIRPVLLEGRWLRPDDENALVMNTDLQRRHSDLRVGGTVDASIEGETRSWRIVGLVRSALEGQTGYARDAYVGRVLGGPSPVGDVRVVARATDPAGQARAAAAVEERLRGAGLRVSLTRTIAERRVQQESNFAVVIGFLMGMTVLLALVGGLGLTGTLSISVIERTREIGVMRAIGADDRDVSSIVVGEGVTIAVVSWLLGLLVALPLGQALTAVVADSFLNGPMTARFSVTGALLWLLLSVALAAGASFLPARNASSLPIREALAYQ